MKILLGLGNPGKKYRNNRHNVGFMVIDSVASSLGVRFKKKSVLLSAVASADIDGETLVLAKPLTYMNNSGLACKRLSAFYKVSSADILVVYDDADLKPGMLRFSKSGSAGGHRGFASLIEIMATTQIKRLRVGIGKPRDANLADYVLSDFDSEEMPVAVIERAGQACLQWVRCGIDAAMQKYNRRLESGEKL